MLERLHVRPELSVFEQALRQRVQHLAAFDDRRFAKPTGVERDGNGELLVLATFVTGSRVSELLDVSSDAAVVPGVDVALGYLLEGLSALSVLHTTGRLAHGLIDSSRTILTADGEVVYLDLAFGPAIERMHLSSERLWNAYGIFTTPGEKPRFDAVGDVTQVALSALMLVLGRNLKPHEYPDALPSLLMEVIEVAHIRGSTAFAGGLQRFLQRSLPLAGRRPFESADEALVEVRQLLRREIGLDVCRQAVIDFVAQMDAAFSQTSDRSRVAPEPSAADLSPTIPELDTFLDSVETLHTANAAAFDTSTGDEPRADAASMDAAPVREEESPEASEKEEEEEEELEISLDTLETVAAAPAPKKHAAKAVEEEVYDLPSFGELTNVEGDATADGFASFDLAVSRPPARTEVAYEPPPPPPTEPAYEAALAATLPPDDAPTQVADAPETASAIEEPAYVPDYEDSGAEAIAQSTDTSDVVEAAEPDTSAVAEPERSEPEPTAQVDPETVAQTAAEPEPEPEPEPQSEQRVDEPASAPQEPPSSRRRKRQQKSARARKDKLRSIAVDHKQPAPPPAPPPPPPQPPPPPPARPATGWLVSPQRAAASETLIPEPIPTPPPPPAPVRHVPAVPSFVPSPVGAFPQPVYPSTAPHQSAYGTPSVLKPGPPAPPIVQPVQPAPIAVKVKPESPAGFTARRSTLPDPPLAPPDRFSTLSLGRNAEEETPREFPWKLAGVVLAVAVVAIVAGRAYLPGAAPAEETAAATESTTPPASSGTQGPASPPSAVDNSPIPDGKGRLLVQTQPPGLKVLLDRKPIGESPLQIDVPPGRRVLTFMTSGGEVMQSVRITAGKTTTLDIPVFSGWLTVISPFALEISEDGRSLGTTEQNRIMLPPGRHQVTFSNKDLSYSVVQTVDIEPGGVRSVTINPKGIANINASPWAEVWLDGTKLGETPIASATVPLGTREFVFRHPELGERRVSTTIRGNATSTVSVDFAK
jgi:hypothetical protein